MYNKTLRGVHTTIVEWEKQYVSHNPSVCVCVCVCVSVGLVIQLAMHMHHVILSSVASRMFFHIISLMEQFLKKRLLNIKSVF